MQGNKRLPVLLNTQTNQRVTVSADIMIGRAPENEVVLPGDEYVSADHAKIFWEQGWYLVSQFQVSSKSIALVLVAQCAMMRSALGQELNPNAPDQSAAALHSAQLVNPPLASDWYRIHSLP